MEEWNEYGEIKENLGAGSAADPLVATPSVPITPSKPPKSASAASESKIMAATPPWSSQTSTMDNPLTMAMRKAGFEAAKGAVHVKSQSRADGESNGFEDIDEGGVERAAERSTTTGLISSVGLETAKDAESRIIASAEQLSSEEEDDEVDEKKVEEKAIYELKTLPFRQKPQNLQEVDEEGDDKGDEEQDEERAETRSQKLSTSKPASKAKKSKVDEDEEDEGQEEEEEEGEEEEDEEDEGGEGEGEDEDGDAGRQQLRISKPPVKATKADDDDDDDEDEDNGEDDDEDEDEEDDDEERVRPVAITPRPKTSRNDTPKFKTGRPLLDHRKLNPANNTVNKK